MSGEEDEIATKLESLGFLNNTNDDKVSVTIGSQIFVCDKTVLISKSRYFEALFNFDPERKQIFLEGDIDEIAGNLILNFINTGSITIDENNFEDILLGSIFLGCPELEDKSVAFICQNLSCDTVFGLHNMSKKVSCPNLANECEKFITKHFQPFLKVSTKNGKLEQFLSLSTSVLLDSLQKDVQCEEKLILFCILGWIEWNDEERRIFDKDLLSYIDFSLISESCKKNLKQNLSLRDYLKSSEKKKGKISKPVKNIQTEDSQWRWPKLLVTLFPGKCGSKKLQYIDLTERSPQWRPLSRKSVTLDLLSGYSMVYKRPRIYFLGERKWHLHWYDVERDEWGVWEGFTIPKLLAGNITIKDDIFLIGGVNVEEWTRGSIELTTTSSVDIINPESATFTDTKRLPKSVSNPSVVYLNGYIYVIGGLQGRKPSRDCFRMKICDASCSWESVAQLPQHFCYPSIWPDKTKNRILIVGGMRIPDRNEGHVDEMRNKTYVYNPDEDVWKLGPEILVPRKSAFIFEVNEDIYLVGGISEDLKPVTVTEILRKDSEKWEKLTTKVRYPCSFNNTVIVHKPRRLIRK